MENGIYWVANADFSGLQAYKASHELSATFKSGQVRLSASLTAGVGIGGSTGIDKTGRVSRAKATKDTVTAAN